MIRFAVVLTGLLLACCAASGDDTDAVKEKLFAAKKAYDKDMGTYRTAVGEWFDKREETARKDGNKKLVDQIKGEREAFDESGMLPKGAPAAISQKAATAKKALEAAYGTAVKEYVKGKKDDEAAAVEKELLDFRKKEFWAHVDHSNAALKDDYLRISPNSTLPTVQKFTGGVEVVVVARTEAENIRLHAQKGARVIFNWEVNPRELRVNRPDGNEKVDSGSSAAAKFTPLKPNTWYTLKWRLTEDGMQVSVDGKVVFEEQKKYDLSGTAPVAVHAEKSIVDVKEFRVTPLAKKP